MNWPETMLKRTHDCFDDRALAERIKARVQASTRKNNNYTATLQSSTRGNFNLKESESLEFGKQNSMLKYHQNTGMVIKYHGVL